MPVQSGKPTAVTDDDTETVAVLVPAEGHFAAVTGLDRGSDGKSDVDSLMHPPPSAPEFRGHYAT